MAGIKPHSHTNAGSDHVIDFAREAHEEPRLDTGRYNDTSLEIAVQEYVDHAGRPTTVREYVGGVDVYHSDDQVGRWKNEVLRAKWDIVQEAERLQHSTDWDSARKAFADLVDRWKAQPRVDRSSEENLWGRLAQARAGFRERAGAEARRVKEQLVSEARAASRSTDWKTGADTLAGLLTRWKAAPRADRVEEERLWASFSAARSEFFQARTRDREQRERKRGHAARVKERLVAEARSAATASDLRAAGDVMRGLMEQWRAAGSAGKPDEDRLWREFSAARDRLAQRRAEQHKLREREQERAKAAKKGLIATAQSLVHGPDFKAATQQMRELGERWKAAGRAARADEDALWAQFNSIRTQLREYSQAAFEQRKREAAERLRDAIDRKRRSLEVVEDRVREKESRISEVLSRPEPSHRNPNRWEVAAKRNETVSRLRDQIGDLQTRRRDIISSIAEMEQKWRGML